MKPVSCLSLLIASVLVTVAASAQASGTLQSIDDAFASGRISREQQVVYRLAALRNPSSLPSEFRADDADGPLARCHTPITIGAYQALPRLSPTAAVQVRNLLAPPADPPYAVEATEPFPVRVGYSDPAFESMAEQVLEDALFAYEKQVIEFGFRAPPVDPAFGAYRMYIASAEGAAGYTSPYAAVAETPHSDSYSYIVIDPSLSGLGLDVTVTHEFNHACQVSMDVEEVTAFMENTATYIEGQVYPGAEPYVAMTFPYFQSQPHRALDYMRVFDSDLYEYGGSLFVTFLEDIYGGRDPRFIRQVWEGSMQPGFVNEPDYFDVLDTMLQDDGGLREAVKAFAESRFFVGSDDDGEHMTNAGSWNGAEVSRVATWSVSQLPVVDQGPADKSSRPQPNGCNYVVLRTGESSPPLRFAFQGDGGLDWWVSLVELKAGGPPVRHEAGLDADGRAELDIAPGDFEGLLAILCQLAPASYDPDERAWDTAAYTYSFDYGFPSPELESIDPPELTRGTHDVTLTLRGSGFADSEGLEVTVSGSGAKLWLDEFVSSEELRLKAAVPPTAPLGARDVTITNPGGRSAVAPGLLTVVDPASEEPEVPEVPSTPAHAADDDSSGGCGCRTGGGRPGAASWIVALVALALAGLRRR
jgi:MYXO-CTERM domain-containing protein